MQAERIYMSVLIKTYGMQWISFDGKFRSLLSSYDSPFIASFELYYSTYNCRRDPFPVQNHAATRVL